MRAAHYKKYLFFCNNYIAAQSVNITGVFTAAPDHSVGFIIF
jgi:hypothetical protein